MTLLEALTRAGYRGVAEVLVLRRWRPLPPETFPSDEELSQV